MPCQKYKELHPGLMQQCVHGGPPYHRAAHPLLPTLLSSLLAWDRVSGGTGLSGAWFFTMVVEAPCRSAWTYTSPLLQSRGKRVQGEHVCEALSRCSCEGACAGCRHKESARTPPPSPQVTLHQQLVLLRIPAAEHQVVLCGGGAGGWRVGGCMQNTQGHGRRALLSRLLLRPPKSHEPGHSRPVPGLGTAS